MPNINLEAKSPNVRNLRQQRLDIVKFMVRTEAFERIFRDDLPAPFNNHEEFVSPLKAYIYTQALEEVVRSY